MKILVKGLGRVAEERKFKVNFSFTFNYGGYEHTASDKEGLVLAIEELLKKHNRYLDKETIKEIVEEYMPPIENVEFEINKAITWNVDRYMKKVAEQLKKIIEIVGDEAIVLPRYKEIEIDVTDDFEAKINRDYDKCENCPLNEPPF